MICFLKGKLEKQEGEKPITTCYPKRKEKEEGIITFHTI